MSLEDYPKDENGTFCGHSINDELKPILLVYCTSGSVCSFFCAFAILLMILCRFFSLLTHRLILYMLLGILFFSSVVAVQFINLWLKFWDGNNLTECVIESYLVDIGKLEPFYILFPWAFPFLIAWIPFIHHDYGISGSWCWIRLYNNDCSLNKEGMIEMYTLWYGELFFALILNNIALVIISITLCKRAYQKTMSLDYRKALKQTLPLLIYPITYQFFSWFAIANRLYQALNNGHYVKWLFYTHALGGPCGRLLAPAFTILYLFLLCRIVKVNIKKWHCLKCCFKPKKTRQVVINTSKIEEDKVTDRLIDPSNHLTMYGTTITCPTSAHLRGESEIEKEYENDSINNN
uniref:G-protein coupled receptors family 2 profile 2 domain-containing protein n=1 Tax=Amphimedon queenslandica TaxID=400682 RepID=A0A1X7ULH1_AMPQE